MYTSEANLNRARRTNRNHFEPRTHEKPCNHNNKFERGEVCEEENEEEEEEAEEACARLHCIWCATAASLASPLTALFPLPCPVSKPAKNKNET